MKRSLLVTLVGISLFATCLAAFGGAPCVLMFLPPDSAMGSEFFDLLDEFEECEISVDVVAEEKGPYIFWEDSNEGQFSGAPGGFYKWTVSMTYDEVDLTGYSAVILGPGFAHTGWFGESLRQAKELTLQAIEQELPVGGVSFGAAVLVSWGLLNGRSAAMPPYYRGVVIQGSNRAYFFAEFPDVTFENSCIWIDETDGSSPIITASYGCVRRFAREIAAII